MIRAILIAATCAGATLGAASLTGSAISRAAFDVTNPQMEF